MLKEMLKRKTQTKRKIEINPYVTDAGMRRGDNKGVMDTILSFIPFGKKKEEPRVNPFLHPKQLQEEEIVSAPEPEPVKKHKGWIWYIPIAIADQVEWLKSHTNSGKVKHTKSLEDKARYDHFMSLFEKKD